MLNGRSAKGEKSEALVRSALLVMLAKYSLSEITVSELCREAGVARGTFYLHYNTVEDVYDQIMLQMVRESSPVQSQSVCMRCEAMEGETPFCELVRDAGDFEPVVNEDRFLLSYLSESRRPAEGSIEHLLLDNGYDMQQARAIKAFLSGGCFAAATKTWISARDWPRIRETIDTFAQGGLDALLKSNTHVPLAHGEQNKRS